MGNIFPSGFVQSTRVEFLTPKTRKSMDPQKNHTPAVFSCYQGDKYWFCISMFMGTFKLLAI